MMGIGMLLNVKSSKTEFIGVDISPNSRDERELKAIAFLGGENADYHNCGIVNIGEVFKRISVNVGLLKTKVGVGISDGTNTFIGVHCKVDPVLVIEKIRYCCLFTLDISGSNIGGRWNKVCNAVRD
jgi:hypothetical protein